MEEKDYLSVMDSYKRSCAKGVFVDTFYKNFFGSSPEIPPLFANTNMPKQKRALKKGLPLLLMFAKKNNAHAKEYLKKITRIHDKIKIDNTLYPLWVDSLIASIYECDPECDEELEAKWRTIVQKGIDYMILGH